MEEFILGMENNQEKLMEMVVDKVFKKYKLKGKQNSLTNEEKEKVKSMVANIREDVESFLKNQSKKKTEKDFSNNDTVTESLSTPTSIKRERVFSQPNDAKSVKYFKKRKKNR
jgi:DNA replication initiation complex subunit (GINS family)